MSKKKKGLRPMRANSTVPNLLVSTSGGRGRSLLRRGQRPDAPFVCEGRSHVWVWLNSKFSL